MEDKKELTGCQRLAIVLAADLKRKKRHKLTQLAKARKHNSKNKK